MHETFVLLLLLCKYFDLKISKWTTSGLRNTTLQMLGCEVPMAAPPPLMNAAFNQVCVVSLSDRKMPTLHTANSLALAVLQKYRFCRVLTPIAGK
jgi:hypothetical protein